MIKAQRQIDPADFTAIPRAKKVISTLPKEIRICAEHSEEVTILESDFSSNPGPSAPFGKAALVGCCDGQIERVIESLRNAR